MSKGHTFSYWMRENLISSWKGLITQDIDYIIFNAELTSFIIVEEKNSFGAEAGVSQAVVFKMLDELLSLNNTCEPYYMGIYLIYAIKVNNTINCYINPNKKGLNFDLLCRYLCQEHENLNRLYYEKWWDTLIEQTKHLLYDCSGQLPENRETKQDRKTKQERSHYRGSNIKNICGNMKKIDWIFVNYCTGFFVLLEERPNSNGKYKPSQKEREIITKIHDLFKRNNFQNQQLEKSKKVKNPVSNAVYKYLGYFLLEFDGNNPDDSSRIWLNNKQINKQDLIDFLNLNGSKSKFIASQYRSEWFKT